MSFMFIKRQKGGAELEGKGGYRENIAKIW